MMKAPQRLHELGQSLWLDNITRDLLDSGTLERYIDELSVTGLTSNPTIFDQAIKNSSAYDAAIRKKVKDGKSGEELFLELALEDLTRAADLFRPIWDRTRGVDGWVSLEVSPLLAHDTARTLAAAKALHARAGRRRRAPSAGGAAQSARHRHREADVQGVPHPARLPSLAARRQRRRPPATPTVGQHGHQGSPRVRRPLCQGARRAVHGGHDARGHLEGPRRSWSARRGPDRRRWRLRGGVGPVRR